ncbi:hypothetical protein [Moorena bouillonii]|nr:hypothetical protein [Moorena bouillonii]
MWLETNTSKYSAISHQLSAISYQLISHQVIRYAHATRTAFE